MIKIKKFLPAILWAIFVLIITGLPGTYFPRMSSFWEAISYDKLVHIFIFATLSFLIFYGFREQYVLIKRRYIYIIIFLMITIGYGLLTEILQMHVFKGRNGNIYDFIADAIGGLLGWFVFHFYSLKKNTAT